MKQHKLNVVLCGTGTVGGTLLTQIAQQQKVLKQDRGLDLRIVGIVDIFNIMINPDGICLEGFNMEQFREDFKKCPKSSLETIHDEVLKLNLTDMVFVDCTASYDIADLYYDFLSKGISIVCANKVAASGDIEHYKKLKRTALENDAKYNFETNVGAGLPLIHTIDDLVKSGDRITKIEAVLSGTLNFIFDTISANVSFSEAVQRAKEERFSEPDPRIDLSGIDVIRKLVILARESGYSVSQEDVEKHLFVPQEYFDGTLDDFWKNLPNLNGQIEEIRSTAEKAGQHLRFVAKLDATDAKAPKASVSLERIDIQHPFYNLEGSNNIIMLHTERYAPHPMIIQGYGAGAGVTAAGVFADILDIVNV
jgi:aspartokinase/homoserine dehydrogenase 1